jgi:predicted nucleic acid-binding protein
MPRRRIYVETSIPSAYYTSRTAPDMVQRRDITRRWWREAIESCELVCSAAVVRELVNGTSRHVHARLTLIGSLEFLRVTDAAMETAELYVRHRIMPADPHEDALHLALASHHKCDAVVTWNCRHLANPNKFNQIRRINVNAGLFVPAIVTPQQLLGGEP